MAGWTDRRYHLGTNEEALGLMTPVLTKGSGGAVLPAHHRTRSDLQGEVTIEDKGETTMDWEDKRIRSGRMAPGWMAEGWEQRRCGGGREETRHRHGPDRARAEGIPHRQERRTPQTRVEGWTGRHYHPGMNKGVFGAEPYALYQAAKISEERKETGQEHTNM